MELQLRERPTNHRKYVIGGSDARTIMGNDEAALLRLWREKRVKPSRKTCRATSSSSWG
jgi:hypothetical protein